MSLVGELSTQSTTGELGISRGLRGLGQAWAGAMIVVLLFGLVVSSVLATMLALVVSVFTASRAWQLFLARSEVLKQNDVAIWGGHARLVSWNPTEGVVFLKNKQVDFVDHDSSDGGGIRVVYSLFGEELVLRVPLEIQTLRFEDTGVLTKEYMPLTVKGQMYWRIADLEKFYLQVSRDIHSASDSGSHDLQRSASRPQFEVAENWLRSMAEEKTRTIVSRIGTGLLIADQLATDLPKAIPDAAGYLAGDDNSQSYRNATDSLADAILAEFQTAIAQYGLEMHRVAIQEVKLPAEIYSAAIEACKASYLPLKARAEAHATRLKLQAEADVIGEDALALKEIAKNVPALAFQDLLAPMFLDFSRRRGAVGSGAPSTSAPS